VNAPALMQRALVHLQGVTVDMSQYESKRNVLCDNLTAMGYELVKPQGPSTSFRRCLVAMMWPSYRHCNKNISSLCRTRLRDPRPLPHRLLRRDHTIQRAMDGFRAVAKAFGMA